VIRSGGDVAAAGAEHGLCTACGWQRCGSNDKPVKIVAVRPFDELDCEAIARKSDDAADAGADGRMARQPRPLAESGDQFCIAFNSVEILMVAKLANVSDTAYGKMIWSLCLIAPQV
jgi:hypothetical protein